MELSQTAHRVDDLVMQSNNLSDEGHFDSANIQENALLCQARLKDMYEPAKKRRSVLEEAMEFYKFHFELDTELQWIKDHLPLALSEELGQNLHQAQNMHKKHKKLQAEIFGHQPVIDKSLESGHALISKNHPESKYVIYKQAKEVMCY